jgi:hypothetical protein
MTISCGSSHTVHVSGKSESDVNFNINAIEACMDKKTYPAGIDRRDCIDKVLKVMECRKS